MKTETVTIPNKSGIFPCGNHILVKPDAIEEKSKEGIYIPDEIRERHQMSVAYGYVIAVGPDAFTHSVEETHRWIDSGWKPVERKVIKYSEDFAQPGDRISFAVHSGRNYIGEDGERYVQMNDTDITAKVTDKVTATSLEAREPFTS